MRLSIAELSKSLTEKLAALKALKQRIAKERGDNPKQPENYQMSQNFNNSLL
jgi:hypothetical protein